jgi:hypothetical protein
MKSRMSTDAPSADLDFDEETWDAERVARHDAKYVESAAPSSSPRPSTSTAVSWWRSTSSSSGPIRPGRATRRTPWCFASTAATARQLVKCAGLQTWRRDIAPQSPKVITYNAEENRPMLDINERIGFVPVAYNGAWKKVLT